MLDDENDQMKNISLIQIRTKIIMLDLFDVLKINFAQKNTY